MNHINKQIATCFGIGFLPLTPGTFGSLIALPTAWIIYELGGNHLLLFFTLIFFFIGIYTSHQYSKSISQKDPSSIVIDEFVGQLLVLSVSSVSFFHYALCLILFRFFDITKIWPIKAFDKNITGGMGIMFDDILAASYSIIVYYCLNLIILV